MRGPFPGRSGTNALRRSRRQLRLRGMLAASSTPAPAAAVAAPARGGPSSNDYPTNKVRNVPHLIAVFQEEDAAEKGTARPFRTLIKRNKPFGKCLARHLWFLCVYDWDNSAEGCVSTVKGIFDGKTYH
jgi:hypothetical protein